MKKATLFILGVLVVAASAYALIYFLYFSKHIVIKEGEKRIKEIHVKEGDLKLERNSILQGNVQIDSGWLELEKGAKIMGNINLGEGKLMMAESSIVEGHILIQQGNISLGRQALVQGDIQLSTGEMRLEEESRVKGNVVLEKGELQKHSSALIEGKKPFVYSTYNWPDALKYFDLLPQEHKEAVGFIFLTHESNTSIRDAKVKKPKEYFEGVYDYKKGELIKMDVRDEALMQSFFEKAKNFFGLLPERRLGVYGVGATTKIYAHDPDFADVYVPSEGSAYVMIHEMGHVMDFKYDFIDHHDPLYSWSAEDALNDYGATHPGEDFAEAYKYYVLNQKFFKELIEENSERQKKYDFLEEYVF